MNQYFLLALASSILGPFFYQAISSHPYIAKFFDGMILASLMGLIILHILPESFEHSGRITFLAVSLGLLGPVILSKVLKRNQCEIQKPFVIISVLGFIAHNMLDGAALIIHPHQSRSSHLLALAIVIHRFVENMALWRTLIKNLGSLISIGAILGLCAAMTVGFFGGGVIFTSLDADILHILQCLACGMLFHILLHPHHITDILVIKKLQSVSFKSQSAGAFCGIILAVLAYIFWPAHSHQHTHLDTKGDLHESHQSQ